MFVSIAVTLFCSFGFNLESNFIMNLNVQYLVSV